MELSRDWITEKHVDAEYKKYVLLAYLQHVDRCFRAVKLYPPLAQLIDHYRMAKALQENKHQLEAQFPRRLTGFDAEKFMLRYERVCADEKEMDEIARILEFSLPKFSEWLEEGKQLYEMLQREICIETVGIVPMYRNEGYLLLRNASSGTRVYSYSVSLFEEAGAAYRGLHTAYVHTFPKSILNSFEQIKTTLIREKPELPNPAVYAVASGREIPVDETFLPIAKRMMLREIAA